MTIPPDVTYIASTIPAQVIRTSGTTMFHIAEIYMGDAMRWVEIAKINAQNDSFPGRSAADRLDPWIYGFREILFPPVPSTAPLDGILGL